MRLTEARWVVVTLVCGLAAAGCGGAAPDTDGVGPEWSAVTDTVGDTVIVRTVDGHVWAGPAVLEPELAIGVLDGPDEYILGNPSSIAVGPDGTIFVLDSHGPIIRAYGADGAHLHDVGRVGGGPGEYEGPDAIATLPDGRLLVRDPANNRIAVFSPGGEHLTDWPHGGGFNTSRRFYVDRMGNSYTTTLLTFGMPPWEWEFGLVRRTADGALVDTLAAPTWEFDRAELHASREGSSSVRRVPFTAQTAWTFSPLGYFVGGVSTDYRIDLYRNRGPVLRLERASWEPVAVRRDEATEERRRITIGLQRNYGSWSWNGPAIPDTKPPFREIFTSEEGDVWVVLSTRGVETMTAAEADAEESRGGSRPVRFYEPASFDVFAPDGRYLGAVEAPPSLRLDPEPVVRGDYLWGVTRDELDVPSITRFRIRR